LRLGPEQIAAVEPFGMEVFVSVKRGVGRGIVLVMSEVEIAGHAG
jgi:hypothetical protein